MDRPTWEPVDAEFLTISGKKSRFWIFSTNSPYDFTQFFLAPRAKELRLGSWFLHRLFQRRTLKTANFKGKIVFSDVPLAEIFNLLYPEKRSARNNDLDESPDLFAARKEPNLHPISKSWKYEEGKTKLGDCPVFCHERKAQSRSHKRQGFEVHAVRSNQNYESERTYDRS